MFEVKAIDTTRNRIIKKQKNPKGYYQPGLPSKIEEPLVGAGATLCLGTDRYPYTVVEIKGKNLILQEDDVVLVPQGVSLVVSLDSLFKRDPSGRKVEVSLRKDGTWRQVRGTDKFIIGSRERYHDPHI